MSASAAAKRKKDDETLADNAEECLRSVRELRQKVVQDLSVARPTPAELGYSDLFEVKEMTTHEVSSTIERFAVQSVDMIAKGQGLTLSLPSHSGALKFIPELDANYLEFKELKRSIGDVSQAKKTAMMIRLMELAHELALKGIHVTKRDLFYTDVKLFEKQTASDKVLEELACMVGCTRSSLGVNASDKGVVAGKVQFMDGDDYIDCTKMGFSGKNIPAFMERVGRIESNYAHPAEFILLVEKDAAFMRLVEDKFYNKYPCIIITGKGEADLATRMFLKRTKETLKIPVLGLFDSDAHGLKILSVYMQGSEAMSHDAQNLATPDIKWLGVRPSDLNKYKIPEQCRLDLTENDVVFATKLLEKPYIQQRQAWAKELQTLLTMKKKAEIQALSSFGFQYLTSEYLPRKLREADWI